MPTWDWKTHELGALGMIRARPASWCTRLIGWGRWIVEWKAASHYGDVAAPEPAFPAWLSPDDSRWHPLILAPARHRSLLRHAAADLAASSDRPTVTVLCGAPASAKSTWAAGQPSHVVGTVLSTDQARARFGCGEHDQSVPAHELVHDQAAHELALQRSVVIDATGWCARDRHQWVRLAHAYGARAVAVRFPARLRTCLRRNRRRERTVPATVLIRMWLRLRCTTARRLRSDGFSHVIAAHFPKETA